jgi:hypothetical protein
VSVLSADHEVACRQLASRDGDRFAGLDWEHADSRERRIWPAPGEDTVTACLRTGRSQPVHSMFVGIFQWFYVSRKANRCTMCR